MVVRLTACAFYGVTKPYGPAAGPGTLESR